MAIRGKFLGNWADRNSPAPETHTSIGRDVGAGAVVFNGVVNGGLVVNAQQAEATQVDRRLVAETMSALRALDADQHVSVVAWMEREFGTQIVKGLSATAHKRVRSYVAVVKGGKTAKRKDGAP